MQTIFTDPIENEKFERLGYVVRPLLTPDQVKDLKTLYESFYPDVPSDYYASLYSSDWEHRQHVDQAIKAIVAEPLGSLLPGYEPRVTAFLTKRAQSTKGRLPLHQDFSYVDTRSEVSVHLWCPLVDVDKTNGCLKVVPGTHRIRKHLSSIPTNPSPYAPVWKRLEAEFAVSVPMQAGSAIFWDERILHGSDDNHSSETRPAFSLALLPRGQGLRIYSWDQKTPSTLQELAVTDEFMMRCDISASYTSEPYPSGATFVRLIRDYIVDPMGEEDLAELRRIQTESSGPKKTGWRGAIRTLVGRA